jgi:hypothetical protein
MRSKVTRLVSPSLQVAAVIASLMLVVPVLLQGATTWVVSFTIDDAFPNAKVGSDLGIAYADYRLLPLVVGDTGCIEAAPTSTGLHAVLNRKIDADGTRCNPAGSDRQYRIRLTAAPQACQKLIAAYGSGVTDVSGGQCELVWTANPRIRVGDLFRKGAASTPLAFLLDKSGANGLSYEIKALTNLTVSADGSNRRTLTYDGQGMLYEFGNGKAKFVAEAFDLDLGMVFERTALSQ